MLLELPRPVIFAHRGASAHSPENTLSSFNLAVLQGADAIELDVKLDEIEDLIAWPSLVIEANNTVTAGSKIVQDYGDSQDKDDFSRLEDDIKKAIDSKNSDYLQQKIRNLSQLIMQVLMKQPGWWVGQLEQLNGEIKIKMQNQSEAERLISLGYRAINNQDVEGLKTAVRQLYGLLPDEIAEDLRGYKSTVMKKGL